MYREGGSLSRYAVPIAVIVLSALAGLIIPMMTGGGPSGPVQPWQPPTLTMTPTAPLPTKTPAPTPLPPTQVPTAMPATATSAPTLAAPTPTFEPSATPVPDVVAVVTGGGLNLRAGPDTGQPIRGTADTGDRFTVVGKSADTQWLQVCCVDGQAVWLSASFVALEGQLDTVPVAP